MKFFLLFLFLPAVSFAEPSIHFDHVSYDFDVIGQQEKVEHEFGFINTGDQDLFVEKVLAS